MTRTIFVRCSFVIPVEVPDDPEFHADWTIEENGCPGTGIVGAALDAHIAKHAKQSTCWACSLQGENKIVEGGRA